MKTPEMNLYHSHVRSDAGVMKVGLCVTQWRELWSSSAAAACSAAASGRGSACVG